jgi:hypothetical protein
MTTKADVLAAKAEHANYPSDQSFDRLKRVAAEYLLDQGWEQSYFVVPDLTSWTQDGEHGNIWHALTTALAANKEPPHER